MLTITKYSYKTKVHINIDVTEWGVLLLINAYCVHNFASTKPNKFNAYGNLSSSSLYCWNYYHRSIRSIAWKV